MQKLWYLVHHNHLLVASYSFSYNHELILAANAVLEVAFTKLLWDF